ncbi:diguanylate cyclase [Phyllobacterium sp. SB3]|uniref:GGDEF domain-containing protein n=1 Tax=Phyllobacterium sp. SB3 TaxID=3156073 RepID=UPI0032AEC53C
MTELFRVRRSNLKAIVVSSLTVGIIVFAAAMFGILSRPAGSLAAIWPANAVLLGVMVRFPKLSSVWGWLSACAGFLFADFVTGGQLRLTFWLTAANMAGALTGYTLFQFLSVENQRLRRPLSVLYFFGIATLSAIVASLTGGGAARIVFDQEFRVGFEFWFVTELVNTIIFLPVILTMPLVKIPKVLPALVLRMPGARSVPLVFLLFSAAASAIVAGPGAIAFPVPALIWSALTYRLFFTAILTLLTCSWLLICITAVPVNFPNAGFILQATSSARLGISLIALGPLTIASVMAARDELMSELSRLANHDMLTGVLSRSAFFDRGSSILAACRQRGEPLAALMIDIDHFKQVNDQYGHAAGDKTLVEFANLVAVELRSNDVFGRMGGEEFAVLLPFTTMDDALTVADRVRTRIEMQLSGKVNSSLKITISGGLASSKDGPPGDLDAILLRADKALYDAKNNGRNRIVVSKGTVLA